MLLLLACTRGTVDSSVPADWPAEGWVLDGVTLVDGDGARSDKALVIAGDTVWAVRDAGQDWPEALEVRDGQGAFVIPCLIDSHTHLAYSGALTYVGERIQENVDATLAWGVVAVVDVGGPTWTWALRDELAADGPRMLATGPFLTAEGSHPCELSYDRMSCVFVDGDGAEQGQRLLDEGADGLKVALSETGIGVTWPRLDPAELDGIVALGAPVFVHVGTAEDAQDASVAQHLAHTPFDSQMTAVPPVESIHSTIGANAGILRAADIPDTVPADVAATWVPSNYPAWQDAAQDWTAQARSNLALLVSEGAPVVAASDAGYYFVPHGLGLHNELVDLVDAGMSPGQALAAATSVPAALYGFDGLGCLDAGCEASFVLLERNPLDDIANTRTVREVVLRGHAVDVDVGSEAFCLDSADCPEACDLSTHSCESSCEAWSAVNDCGPDAWCTGAGLCHTEQSCDWRGGDCSDHYAETCVPADADTGYCWPSGQGQVLDACSYDVGSRCAQGLYCSPVSLVCLEFCEEDADCGWGSCQWQTAGDEDWFGLCY